MEQLPEGCIVVDKDRGICTMPVALTHDSRYRSRLRFDPKSRVFVGLTRLYQSSGQDTPLTARLVDGRVEVLGDELRHDVLRATGGECLIRLVEPDSELHAYRLSNEEPLQAPPRCAYEKVLQVRQYAPVRGAGFTQRELGALLQVHDSTISHREKYARAVTPDSLLNAGIREDDVVHANKLRELKDHQLKWVANGKTVSEQVSRLADIVLGTGQLWAEFESEKKGKKARREPIAAAYEIAAPEEGQVQSTANPVRMTKEDLEAYLGELREVLEPMIEG